MLNRWIAAPAFLLATAQAQAEVFGNAIVTLRTTARRHAVTVVAGLFIASNASAQNLGTIFSDLWWIPAESGWGVTVDHQQDVMFLIFFVYRSDGSPYWVTATLQKVGIAGLATLPQVFAGDLYETHGPPFNVPFNTAPVTNRKVGTATFTATTGNAASLQYSIDDANGTKNIEHQTLRNVNFTGGFSAEPCTRSSTA
jgi:hypothetical protein